MPPTPGTILLNASKLTKVFGGTAVLKDVDLCLRAGEIHGLVGENGAGKSTLARIIAGVHAPEGGSLEVSGKPYRPSSPHDATERGVALIHQEPSTFPDLGVAENVFAGRQPRARWGGIDWRRMNEESARWLATLGSGLDPASKVRGLSVADQQLVEMASALSQDARVLIMDETTASLTPSEARNLFSVMRSLRDKGVALAFIGHRMEEIFDICDRVTILRDGYRVAEKVVAETTTEEVLRLMVGRDVEALYERVRDHEIGGPLLEVEGARGGRFHDVSLSVHAGEVLGLAGLVGAGRTELARALVGADPLRAGRLTLCGRRVHFSRPSAALNHGLVYVPEDRRNQAVLGPMSISVNTTMSVLRRISTAGWLRRRRQDSMAESALQRFSVRMRALSQPIAELSGGNQQKVVLARALLAGPKVLILDEPTRGIDIGAKVEVHRLIHELAANGLGILMISSDLPEVLAMSDRIIVMREGVVTAEIKGAEATAEAVIAAAARPVSVEPVA